MDLTSLPSLALLMKAGVAPAIPFVMQFVLDLFPKKGEKEYSKRITKTLLPIPIGMVVGLLYATLAGSLPEVGLGLVVIDGGIAGAMASAAYSLTSTIAKKVGS